MNRILILLAATAASAIAVSSACFAGDERVHAALSPRSASQSVDIDLRSPFAAAGAHAWLQGSLL